MRAMRTKTNAMKSFDLADLPEEYVRYEFPEYYDSMKKIRVKEFSMYLFRSS